MADSLDALMQTWAANLRKTGIPVSEKIAPEVVINTRAKKRLGCCIHKKGSGYTIEISAALLEEGEKGAGLLTTTLIHELLHTCPGCGNHGAGWKHYAQVAGKAFGYPITRTILTEKMPAEHRPVKYFICCRQCGMQVPRYRRSTIVQYPQRYRCGRCGGKLEVYVPAEDAEK